MKEALSTSYTPSLNHTHTNILNFGRKSFFSSHQEQFQNMTMTPEHSQSFLKTNLFFLFEQSSQFSVTLLPLWLWGCRQWTSGHVQKLNAGREQSKQKKSPCDKSGHNKNEKQEEHPGDFTGVHLIPRISGGESCRGKSSYKHFTVHTDLHCVGTWCMVLPGNATPGILYNKQPGGWSCIPTPLLHLHERHRRLFQTTHRAELEWTNHKAL